MNYILIFLFISPYMWITSSVNINIMDFFPLIVFLILLKKRKFILTKEEIIVLKVNMFLVFITLLSTFISFMYFHIGNINPFLQFYRRIISLIFIPLFVFLYFDNVCELRKKIAKNVVIVFILVALIGELVNFYGPIREFIFLHFLTLHQILVPGIFRNAGFTGEASYFANILFLGFLFILFTKNIKDKTFILFLFLIFIFSTFSKSTIIAMFITLFFYFLYNKKIIKLFFYIIILIGIIGIIIYYVNLWNDIYIYFTSRAESSFSERSNYLWIKTINFIYDHPISMATGLGFKGLKYYANMAGAHNEFLSLFANFGFFSVIYFLIFFLLYPYLVFKITKDKLFIFISIFLFVESFVHEPIIHSQVLLIYMFFLSIIIKDYINKRRI